MKTKYYFLAAIASLTLASCSSDDFVGDLSPTTSQVTNETDAINFGFDLTKVTRGDIAGAAAATLLGNNFYVTGTKGTEPDDSPTKDLVFDNYLVHYAVNTAGTTESNTANWEYVGIEQAPTSGSPTVADRVKLSSTTGPQTIKYWDYSVAQYDFLAFSTGTFAAVNGNSTAETNIGVTAMKYGADLKSSGVAYTFDLPNVNALKNAFISDIKEVTKTSGSYGKEVTLRFKNLGSKVRIALYETVPGYSVRDVKFYQVDGTNADLATATKYDASYLIGDDNNSFPTNAKIKVYFPHVGNSNASETDYDLAAATVEPATGDYAKYKTFGALTDQLISAERAEKKWDATNKKFVWNETDKKYENENAKVFLGRTLPDATFAGDENAAFYETVFPVSTAYPLTLRVDYTLVPIDGATEVINVYGARAVVPSTYTKWLPNYAYTYVFKISDNTNGWTSTVSTDPAGLFPITFDAVVAESTDATGEQTTVTTVATPSITTYQQGHNPNTDGEFTPANEYDNDGKNLYVQVMNNSTSPASLVNDLDKQTVDDTPTDKSLLYLISRAAPEADAATEAEVMDALQNRTTAITAANVTGRNGITLTKQTSGTSGIINNEVTSIANGVDDNPITVAKGSAAEIAIASLTADKYYAYVYDYSDAKKTTTDIYQPIAVEINSTDVNEVKYVTYDWLKNTWDKGIATEPTHYTTSTGNVPENAAAGYLYFSITTNGGADKTYSFISVDDKIGTALPDGLLKVPVGQLSTGGSGDKAAANTFYFTIYTRNTGKYAVKVIKIVD